MGCHTKNNAINPKGNRADRKCPSNTKLCSEIFLVDLSKNVILPYIFLVFCLCKKNPNIFMSLNTIGLHQYELGVLAFMFKLMANPS